MNVDTGEFRALQDQADAARAETDAVLRAVDGLYHVAYSEGHADALGQARPQPTRPRGHLRAVP
jgi:hypothetical protein